MLMGTSLIILSGNQIIYGLSWKLNTILANGWLNSEVLVQDSLSTCVVYPKINKKYNSFHPCPTTDRSNQFGMTHIFCHIKKNYFNILFHISLNMNK